MVGSEEEESEKKSFSIRGINAQTDTGLCVHYMYVIRPCERVCAPCYSVSVRRVRKCEHTSIRLPVLRYNRETERLPDNGKDVKSDPRVPFSSIPIYYYTYIYSRRRRIHVFRHGKLARTYTRISYTRDLYVCIFERKVLIGLDIKIPRKSLLGFWTCGVRVSKHTSLSITYYIIYLISYVWNGMHFVIYR